MAETDIAHMKVWVTNEDGTKLSSGIEKIPVNFNVIMEIANPIIKALRNLSAGFLRLISVYL